LNSLTSRTQSADRSAVQQPVASRVQGGDEVEIAGARLVRDVWVAGEQVITEREPTTAHRAKVQAAAGEVTRRLR
jgi:hypothetical protein